MAYSKAQEITSPFDEGGLVVRSFDGLRTGTLTTKCGNWPNHPPLNPSHQGRGTTKAKSPPP